LPLKTNANTLEVIESNKSRRCHRSRPWDFETRTQHMRSREASAWFSIGQIRNAERENVTVHWTHFEESTHVSQTLCLWN